MKKIIFALFVMMLLITSCGEEKKTAAKQNIIDSSEKIKYTIPPQPKTKILGNEFVCSGEISGIKMMTYYQGRKFRVEIETSGSANVPKTKSLYDYAIGEMWVWNEEMKFGQHVSKEALQKIKAANYPEVPENPSYDMIVAEWEEQGFTCQEKDLPDSLFQIPTDIQFTERI